MAQKCDVLIAGAGPAGLTAGLFCRMRRLRAVVVEAERAGGQMITLYPRKIVRNYPTYQAVLAEDLAERLILHAAGTGVEIREDERVEGFEEREGLFRITTSRGDYDARAVIVAVGFGIFKPRKLGVPGELQYSGRGVTYKAPAREAVRGREVVVVGGGDSALDIALTLADVADVTVVNRARTFKAQEASLEALGQAPVHVLPEAKVKEIVGNGEVREVVVSQDSDGERRLEADMVVISIGLEPNLGPIKDWPLDMRRNFVEVGPGMATSRTGVFACGDVVDYPGKAKLLVTACGEGATAANAAYQYLKG